MIIILIKIDKATQDWMTIESFSLIYLEWILDIDAHSGIQATPQRSELLSS